mmetsp:Transcript_3400/g.5699  ORF Transcript_3400/g.5699 Transcript_3400/m.5699 type:complete len:221 (+) Transcript_3400:1166-1828(+)
MDTSPLLLAVVSPCLCSLLRLPPLPLPPSWPWALCPSRACFRLRLVPTLVPRLQVFLHRLSDRPLMVFSLPCATFSSMSLEPCSSTRFLAFVHSPWALLVVLVIWQPPSRLSRSSTSLCCFFSTLDSSSVSVLASTLVAAVSPVPLLDSLASSLSTLASSSGTSNAMARRSWSVDLGLMRTPLRSLRFNLLRLLTWKSTKMSRCSPRASSWPKRTVSYLV